MNTIAPWDEKYLEDTAVGAVLKHQYGLSVRDLAKLIKSALSTAVRKFDTSLENMHPGITAILNPKADREL